ncbi:unnamed protein product [Effrenium voratum]|nr:unnamed protein product [Effrenium voratum]
MRQAKILPNEVCCSAAVSACEKVGVWRPALGPVRSGGCAEPVPGAERKSEWRSQLLGVWGSVVALWTGLDCALDSGVHPLEDPMSIVKIALPTALLVAPGAAIAACARLTPKPKELAQEGATAVFLGDSLTQGTVSANVLEVLAERCRRRQAPAHLVNMGLNFRALSDLTPELLSEAKAFTPSHGIVLQLGSNDLIRYSATPSFLRSPEEQWLESYAQRLREAVQRLLPEKVVLVSPPPLGEDVSSFEGRLGAAMARRAAKAAKELDCGYVPLFETCVAQLGQGRPYKLSEFLLQLCALPWQLYLFGRSLEEIQRKQGLKLTVDLVHYGPRYAEMAAELLEAVAVLFGMAFQRIPTCAISWNAAISACEKGRRWRRALDLLVKTSDRDAISYRAAITAACHHAQWIQALLLLRDLEELSLEAGAQACGFLINACEARSKGSCLGFLWDLSAWIVCGHFIYVERPTPLTSFRHRGNAAVNFFVVLSGFMTQWAYGGRVEKLSEVRSFYLRRVGRVVLTTWLSMMLGLVVVLVQSHGNPLDWWHVLRCFCFVETWRDPMDWCPNGQTWTVAALLPSWLLFPLTRRFFAQVEYAFGDAGLLAAALVLYAISAGPMLLLFLQQGDIPYRIGFWNQTWPPATLCDFALGVVAAMASQRHGAWAKLPRDLLADVSLLAAVLTCLLVPSSGYRTGWEPLFNHGCSLLFAAHMYGSSIAGTGSLTAGFLSFPALVALGEYSFEVYLFQYPVHEIFVAMADITHTFGMKIHGKNANSQGFMTFFLVLWLVSGLYAEHVEKRLIRWLRAKSEEFSGGRPALEQQPLT